MSDIAAWVQVVLACVALYLQLRQPSQPRRRERRVETRWKGFGVEWSRRTEDTDHQG